MSVHDFTVKKKNGEEICLREYKDKVLLIVNTASKCGFTSQYAELEKLYKELEQQKAELLEYLKYLYTSQLIKSQRMADILN